MTVTVGIRELRNNLRSFLDRVKAGEDVIVTERGRPIARITDPDGMDTLQRLIAEGLVTPPSKPKTPVRREDLIPVKGSVTEILLEQRRSARY